MPKKIFILGNIKYNAAGKVSKHIHQEFRDAKERMELKGHKVLHTTLTEINNKMAVEKVDKCDAVYVLKDAMEWGTNILLYQVAKQNNLFFIYQ